MPPTALDFETVREIATALPDVKESLGARGWAFRLRGKLLAFKAIHRSAEAGTLAARIDIADRTAMIAADPNVFYVTAHYVDYPIILVRISRISRERLSEVVVLATPPFWLATTMRITGFPPARCSGPHPHPPSSTGSSHSKHLLPGA